MTAADSPAGGIVARPRAEYRQFHVGDVEHLVFDGDYLPAPGHVAVSAGAVIVCVSAGEDNRPRVEVVLADRAPDDEVEWDRSEVHELEIIDGPVGVVEVLGGPVATLEVPIGRYRVLVQVTGRDAVAEATRDAFPFSVVDVEQWRLTLMPIPPETTPGP